MTLPLGQPAFVGNWMARILAVDDDRDQLLLYDGYLRMANHEPLLLSKPLMTLDIIRQKSPDLLICDIMMPGITGGSVYEMVRQEIGKYLPILIVSGTKLRLRSAMSDPLLAYCSKPVSHVDLHAVINTLLAESNRLRQEDGFDITGDSSPPTP